MSKPLIEITAGCSCPERNWLSTDAFFIVDNSKSLVLKPGMDSSLVASCLAHCITRNPLDLRAHTQRVYLFYSSDNRNGLYSALLDLFIALGDKGLSLRQLLLNHSRRKLHQDQISFFESRLFNALQPNSIIDNIGHSLLHTGKSSSLTLISKQEPLEPLEPKGFIDPIQEAQEYLEYGQLDLALDILESAMENTPGNREISQELLHIYILARSTDRYQKMVQKIIQSGQDLPANWEVIKP
jgi:hypothetical protein